MNMSASQCSSSGGGCESGWTLYLGQSSISKNQFQGFGGFADDGNCNTNHNARFEDEEEVDLSMVSDASSGPPHDCEDDEEYCFDHHQLVAAKKNKTKKKSNEYYGRNQHQYSYLDDTASSPLLTKKVGKNNEASMEFSQGFSATHFKGKSSLKKHFGFLQSSLGEKSASKEPGGHNQGRK